LDHLFGQPLGTLASDVFQRGLEDLFNDFVERRLANPLRMGKEFDEVIVE
jgi:hypothetical protein